MKNMAGAKTLDEANTKSPNQDHRPSPAELCFSNTETNLSMVPCAVHSLASEISKRDDTLETVVKSMAAV